MKPMKRRSFLQSLAAVIALPANALALKPAAAALPSATIVPAKARSWAVYMSTLHGECTPQTLQNLLNIPASDARHYVSQLIADGVLKPNPLLQHAASRLARTRDDSVLDKIKQRLQKKSAERANIQEPSTVQDETGLAETDLQSPQEQVETRRSDETAAETSDTVQQDDREEVAPPQKKL